MATKLEIAARKYADLEREIKLVDDRGITSLGRVKIYRGKLSLYLTVNDAGEYTYPVETLERLVKQAKRAAKRNIV